MSCRVVPGALSGVDAQAVVGVVGGRDGDRAGRRLVLPLPQQRGGRPSPTTSTSLSSWSTRASTLRIASSLARFLSLLFTTVHGAASVSVARNIATFASV